MAPSFSLLFAFLALSPLLADAGPIAVPDSVPCFSGDICENRNHVCCVAPEDVEIGKGSCRPNSECTDKPLPILPLFLFPKSYTPEETRPFLQRRQDPFNSGWLVCDPTNRQPCGDPSVSSDVCSAINCCWSDTGIPGIPSCYFPLSGSGAGGGNNGGGGGRGSPNPEPSPSPIDFPPPQQSPSPIDFPPPQQSPSPVDFPPPQESPSPIDFPPPQESPSPVVVPPSLSPAPPQQSPTDPGMYIPPPSTFAPLSACQASIIQQMTNEYENSRVQFSYDYCEDYHDGRGYTAGMVGFTTGTYDANMVVQLYKQMGGTEFDSYLSVLASKGDSGSLDGLDGYCDAWRQAASNPLFREAQVQIFSSLYWQPALSKSIEIGLKMPVSFGFMYDSWIQHGEGESVGVLNMLSQVGATPAQGRDEMEWLQAFFQVRTNVLESTSGWQGTSYRVRSYKYVADNSPNFTDGPITILDNGGAQMSVQCRLSLWSEYDPCYPNCG